MNECLREITAFQKRGGSHQKAIFSNRHGQLGRVIIPRGSRNPNWGAKSQFDRRPAATAWHAARARTEDIAMVSPPSAPNPRSITNKQAIKNRKWRQRSSQQCRHCTRSHAARSPDFAL